MKRTLYMSSFLVLLGLSSTDITAVRPSEETIINKLEKSQEMIIDLLLNDFPNNIEAIMNNIREELQRTKNNGLRRILTNIREEISLLHSFLQRHNLIKPNQSRYSLLSALSTWMQTIKTYRSTLEEIDSGIDHNKFHDFVVDIIPSVISLSKNIEILKEQFPQIFDNIDQGQFNFDSLADLIKWIITNVDNNSFANKTLKDKLRQLAEEGLTAPLSRSEKIKKAQQLATKYNMLVESASGVPPPPIITRQMTKLSKSIALTFFDFLLDKLIQKQEQNPDSNIDKVIADIQQLKSLAIRNFDKWMLIMAGVKYIEKEINKETRKAIFKEAKDLFDLFDALDELNENHGN